MLIKKQLFAGLMILTFCEFATAAGETPYFFNYQSYMTNSLNNPLPSTSFNLEFRIMDPTGACILYDETQNGINSDVSAMISVNVGTVVGSGARSVLDPGIAMSSVFNNLSAVPIVPNSANCTLGGGYTPAAGDVRLLRVLVNGTVIVPDATIGAVPMAHVAETLQGLKASNFVQVQGTVTQASLAGVTAGAAVDASAYHNHNSLYAQINGSGATNFTANNEVVNGTLGVGTASPNASIDIEKGTPAGLIIGSTGVGGNTMSLNFDSNNGATTNAQITATDNANILTFKTGGVPSMTLNANQSVSFANSIGLGGGLGLWSSSTDAAYVATLGVGQEGTIWENRGTQNVRYWNGVAAVNLAQQQLVVNSIAAGTGTTVGGTATTPTINVTLGGDITGIATTTSVSKLQGSTLTITAPVAGNVLTYVGGIWVNQAPAAAVAAGATTQIQYNNAGAFAGSGDFIWNNAAHSLTVDTASAPVGDALIVAQNPLGGGAGAANSLVKLGATDIAGGNTNGTYLGVNQPAATADLINYQVAGTNKFLVDKSGNVTATSFTGNGAALTNISAGNIGGTLLMANGGTGAALAATNGGIIYSGATAMAVTVPGAANQVLASTGAGAPAWTTNMTVDNGNHVVTLDPTSVTPTTDALVINVNPVLSGTTSLARLGTTDLVGGSPSGTYIGVNQTSPTSDFINYEVAGTNKFVVDKNGVVTASGFAGNGGGLTGITPSFAGLTTGGIAYATNATTLATSAAGAANQTLISNGTNPVWTSNLTVDNVNRIVTIDGAGVPVGDALAIPQIPTASGGNSLVKLGATDIVGGNTSGTYIGVNQAGTTADFLLYQVAGVTKFNVDKFGNILSPSTLTLGGAANFQSTLTVAGNLGVGNLAPTNQLSINPPSFGDGSADALIATGSITKKALVLQGAVGQTADPFEVQNSGGVAKIFVDSNYMLNLGADPTANLGAATKQYVNAVVTSAGGNYVGVGGTTPLTGPWTVGFQSIVGVGQLGVGTTVPTATVDVTGTINASNKYLLNEAPFIAGDTLSNAFLGAFAGIANTGTGNTFVGDYAGQSANSGSSDTFIGNDAGYMNSTGYDNTYIGSSAAFNGSTGANNTVVGAQAASSGNPFTGNDNVIIGTQAGSVATSSSFDTLVGFQAGTALTTGGNNTLIGYLSGAKLTTAANNTVVGYEAGYNMTTASPNTLIGYLAGTNITTGSNNTMLGFQAGSSFTGAGIGANTFIGDSAGKNVSTGNNNTTLGYQSAVSLTTGSGNVFIGMDSDSGIGGTSDSVAIGFDSTTQASTAIAIGEGAIVNAGSTGSIAIGAGSNVSGGFTGSTALGFNALVQASNATQIGTGTNTHAGTVQVGTQTIVDPNYNIHGANIGLYVGTATFNTSLGYAGGKAACTAVVAGSHMCTALEMALSSEEGITTPIATVVVTGLYASDCSGFATAVGSSATVWQSGKPLTGFGVCSTTQTIACCQ